MKMVWSEKAAKRQPDDWVSQVLTWVSQRAVQGYDLMKLDRRNNPENETCD